VCGEGALCEFLNLGELPLANRFVKRGDLGVEPRFPLRAAFCRGCKHVQLIERVDPRDLYEEYLYVSSCSRTLVEHLEGLAQAIVDRVRPTGDDLAVDIGSNDGTLLSAIARRGVRVLGIDPARNLAGLAAERGVPTWTTYFGAETAGQITKRHGRATVISATNSFPHIPLLNDYMQGVNELLAPEGCFVIEAHYLGDIVEQVAFDTIYHEHVSYWALGPLAALYERHGFEIADAERLPVHHGQLRVWARRKGQQRPAARVGELIRRESELGLDRLDTFQAFAEKARRAASDLASLLGGLKREGRRVAGYGAPAKASTLAGAAGITGEMIGVIADKNPLKQGRTLPGTGIPILAPEQMLHWRPDYIVILAWNFAEEIMSELVEFRNGGGKFILPVPEVRIL
jgi:SAM-dependent methyltransferase